ncbi:MAG: thiamine diphosphokinase [Clostridia bacterium]|nr:thiamine diphosphokinase [Clostridia bacterium]
MERICYLVGAGFDCGLDFCAKDGDLVIGVDGGAQRLFAQNIAFDLAIGDFDSCKGEFDCADKIVLNPVKDFTDMHCAVMHAEERGYTRFVLYGADGGRISHTIANLQLIHYISAKGNNAVIKGVNADFYAVTNGTLHFTPRKSGYISVFAYDHANGVYLNGLKYPLENAILTNSFPLGVSNEFIGQPATVSVRQGSLLVVVDR